MKTAPVRVDALGAIALRELALDEHGELAQFVTDDGEVRYRGTVLVPGRGGSEPVALNLKHRPNIDPATLPCAVVIRGDARISAWDMTRNRTRNTGLTLTADRVETTEDRPMLRGRGIPVSLPGPMAIASVGRRARFGEDDLTPVELMLPPEIKGRNVGAVEVLVAADPDFDVLDRAIPVGVEADLVAADDGGRVGAYNKASLKFRATRLDRPAPAAQPEQPKRGGGRPSEASEPEVAS